MKNYLSILLFSLLLFGYSISVAQKSATYIMGSGAGFSPLLPADGWTARSVSSLYWAGKIVDSKGEESKLVDRVTGFYQQFVGQYVFNTDIIGAKYVVGAMIPFATAETNPTNSNQVRSRLFMSDPYISPIGLSWQDKDYQIFLEYRMYLPWGQFDETRDFNVGNGYYSHIISLNSIVFFDQFKYWSASIMPRFEFHGKEKNEGYYYWFLPKCRVGCYQLNSPNAGCWFSRLCRVSSD